MSVVRCAHGQTEVLYILNYYRHGGTAGSFHKEDSVAMGDCASLAINAVVGWVQTFEESLHCESTTED